MSDQYDDGLMNADSLYGDAPLPMNNTNANMDDYNYGQQEEGGSAIAISKEFILGQGRFPQNSLRKPRVKKDVTCLRGKGSQYRDLTEALDLLLDGPSSVDK